MTEFEGCALVLGFRAWGRLAAFGLLGRGEMMTDLSSALDAYVECALWSSTHFADENDPGTPFDEVGVGIAPEALAEMSSELTAFLEDPELADDLALISPSQAAHDFWLTRNHHGVGFWDRGLGEAGERLTAAAHAYGPSDLYLGDDGLIYVV